MLIFSPGVQAAKQRAADEYELKAAFLFNIVKFVEWPSEAFAGASAPIVIGVSGADPFGARLDRVVDGQTVNGRPFRVERFPGVADVRGCHIVFVNGARIDARRVQALTIGDSNDFCARGGMIGLVVQGERLALEVNLAAVERFGLKISAQLLKLARIVDGLA